MCNINTIYYYYRPVQHIEYSYHITDSFGCKNNFCLLNFNPKLIYIYLLGFVFDLCLQNISCL